VGVASELTEVTAVREGGCVGGSKRRSRKRGETAGCGVGTANVEPGPSSRGNQFKFE
jgi:hypothetical protein